MEREELIRNLKYVKKKEKDRKYFTGEVNTYDMACDILRYLENENKPREIDVRDCETFTPYWNDTDCCWCYFTTLNKELRTGVMINITTVPTMQAFIFDDYTFMKRKDF